MAIEIVALPIKNMVMFHRFLDVYQRVAMENPTASVKMSEVENALCGVKKATWSLRHLGCFTDSFTALDWLPWG